VFGAAESECALGSEMCTENGGDYMEKQVQGECILFRQLERSS